MHRLIGKSVYRKHFHNIGKILPDYWQTILDAIVTIYLYLIDNIIIM